MRESTGIIDTAGWLSGIYLLLMVSDLPHWLLLAQTEFYYIEKRMRLNPRIQSVIMEFIRPRRKTYERENSPELNVVLVLVKRLKYSTWIKKGRFRRQERAAPELDLLLNKAYILDRVESFSVQYCPRGPTILSVLTGVGSMEFFVAS